MKTDINCKIETELKQWGIDHKINFSAILTQSLLALKVQTKEEIGAQAKIEYEKALRILTKKLFDDDRGENIGGRPEHLAETWAGMLRPYGYNLTSQDLLNLARQRLLDLLASQPTRKN